MALLSFSFSRKKGNDEKKETLEEIKEVEQANATKIDAPSNEKPKTESKKSGTKTISRLRKATVAETMVDSTSPMVKILEETPNPLKAGDLVEGKIIDIHKSSLFIELPPFGTGIIYGREFINARDLLKKVGIGDN